MKFTNLEEVNLDCAVRQVQHNGTLGPEPVGEEGQACQLVTVSTCHVGTGLEKVLTHVATEVLEQRYLREAIDK